MAIATKSIASSGSTASCPTQARSTNSTAPKCKGTVQKRSRATKTGKLRIPPPQAARMMQRYIAGDSIREIARVEGRDRGTVTRIVQSEEMQAHVQQMREQYYGLADLAMDNLRRALEQNSDGRLAHEILRNLGVIPTAEEAALQRTPQPGPHDGSRSGEARDVASRERGLRKSPNLSATSTLYERSPAPATDHRTC